MLNAIIRFSLRYRFLVILASLAVLIYGGYQTATLPIDVFPDLDRPRVVVQTECPGLAPEEVETLVTFPLESALLGANGVQAVRSQSAIGLSVVYVEFDWGTPIMMARQVVQERLSTATDALPTGVRPQLAPIGSIMGQIVMVGMAHRVGPHGGSLAGIGQTGYLAELVHDLSEGRVTLFLLDARKGRLPSQWPLVDGDPEAVRLTGTGGLDLLLAPNPRRTGEYAVQDASLIWTSEPERPLFEWRARITVNSQAEDVVFRSILQRQLALRTVADWVARPRLQKIAGIAQVTVMGGERKQYQALVDPSALLQFGVSLQQVEEALKKANQNSSGGYALQGEMEVPVRLFGRLGPEPERVLHDLHQVPVRPGEKRGVPLESVARVVEGAQQKRGDASVNGRPAVVLNITKQPHADTRALTDQVVEAVQELQASLPPEVVLDPELFQLKTFIDRGIWNVGEALVIGAGLVILILFLFLLNFRTTFISLTAIPLSLVITGLVFKLVGWLSGTALSINVMTLGGIAVAMGELVDDAIVDVENIFRRLRENNTLPNPRPALRVIYEASVEIRSAIVFGTMMVILVFLPLFALSGVEGRLFAPLGVAYIVSILASLLVSLTVTPVLASFLLPQAKATHRQQDSWLLRVLKGGASYLIRLSMAWTKSLVVLAVLLVAASVWLLTRLGGDFLPPFNEGSLQVNLTLPAGSSLDASNQACAAADTVFRDLMESEQKPQAPIRCWVRRSGRAELDEHAEPVNTTEYVVTLNPKSELRREEVIELVSHRLLADVPGVDIEVEQPLAHLIGHMLSGVTAQIAIKIYGDDLDQLRRTAEQIKTAIASVDGLTPPVIEAQKLVDEVHIRLRPDDLTFYQLDRAYVADFVQTALQGEVVSQVLEGQRRFDLLVRLDEPYRSDLAHLDRLRLNLPDGHGQVSLGEIADIGPGVGANVINRENARRRLVIRCNAAGRDLAGVVADLRQRVRDQVMMPEGYFVDYGGLFESQQRAALLIGGLSILAVVGMATVLFLLYPSLRIVLQIVLIALPTAFIGGVLALWLTGQTLSVAGMVGFISLGGIAVRNGILLLTHYFHLMRHEGETFSPQMILRGSLERLAPVLMTALTAGIALVPLVAAGHEPGREILYPVATVILGGLVTSTFCEFLIHPGVFWRFSGQDVVRLVHQKDEEVDFGTLAG